MGTFGAFGKLPALGDFFQFGLPRAFTDPWDRWLQQALVATRGELGARWDDCYLTTPIWRFGLAPGLAGPDAAFGVLMPSVDRVGRQFPLTIAALAGPEAGILHRHLAMEATFQALERIALTALEDDATPDSIATELAKLRLPAAPHAPRLYEVPGRVTLVGGAEGIAPALAAACTAARGGRVSVWSSHIGTVNRLMQLGGLPDPAAACGLFDLSAPVWGATMVEV